MAYIPGFSGAAFGAGLQRDVRTTREDQARKARELEKYQSRRGALGKYGGMIAGAAAGALLTPVLGPGGVMVGKAVASGLGSAAGSSKLLSGKGPSMQPGVDTGLLGSTYRQLGEAKGGIDEAMWGQAAGAGAASLASGLAGAGGKALGQAFGQTETGMRLGELKSGYGKMMAERGINVGAQMPEGASGIFNRAGEFVPNQEVQSLAGSGLGRGFDYGASAANQLTEDRSWYDKAPGFYGVQQGGYMPRYQAGGPTDMEMMRHTENLREKYGLEKPEVYDWQQSASEKRYGALKASEESERESSRLKALAELGGMGHAESARESEGIYQQSLGDMDRGNIQSLLGLLGKHQYNPPEEIASEGELRPTQIPQGLQKLIPEGRYKGDEWLSSIPEEGIQQYLQGTGKGYENIVSGLGAKMPATMNIPRLLESSQGITDEGEGWDYFQQQRGKLGFQMGGMMPGGVSNPLPYNLGGSVAQQPMAYQLGGLLKYRRSPFG